MPKRTRLKKSGRLNNKTRLTSVKPVLKRVWVEQVIDESPDLSWLETEMKDGKIISSARYTNDDIKTHGLAKVKKWIAEDHKRLDSYGTEWVMTGIIAHAEVLIPKKTIPPSYQIVSLQSGGLWGIESDSDKSYLKSIKSDELEDLADNLAAFGIKGSKVKKMLKAASFEEKY